MNVVEERKLEVLSMLPLSTLDPLDRSCNSDFAEER